MFVFFTLTCLLAWAWWIASISLASPSISPTLLGLIALPGTFAPAIVALWLTARAEGPAGVSALLGRTLRAGAGPGWYLLAVFYVAAAKLIAAVAHRLIAGEWPVFAALPWYALFAATFLSTPFQAGEELGWRGYALPRLTTRFGLARASILLGAIWAAWHLPLFYLPGTNTTGQPFLPYALAVTALSVAMAALYRISNGSLLLMMVMHAAANNMGSLVSGRTADATDPLALQASTMAWLVPAALWVGAGCFLFWMSRREDRTGPPL